MNCRVKWGFTLQGWHFRRKFDAMGRREKKPLTGVAGASKEVGGDYLGGEEGPIKG